MRPTTFYISGPMAGCEDYNRPAFRAAAETLRARGYDVLSPAELPAPDTVNPTWTDWMRAALRTMLHADAVVMLKGWQRSKGARIEFNLAVDLGLRVHMFDELAA